MKNLVCILMVIGIAFSASGQLTGKIPNIKNQEWFLTNNSGKKIAVKGNENGEFKVNLNTLEKGLYSFGDLEAIYLEPHYTLNLLKNGDSFTFSGVGSRENNLIQEIASSWGKVTGNSGYLIDYKYLITEPSAFIPVLDLLVQNATSLAQRSDHAFFKKIVIADAQIDKLYCLYAYERFYGLDSSKMGDLRKILAIPLAERKPDHREQLRAAYEKQFSKKLTPEERADLRAKIYADLDLNNPVAFAQTKHYKDMVGYKMDYLINQPQYQSLKDSLQDSNRQKLYLTTRLITDPTIKAYFSYVYTLGAIKSAKRPVEVTDLYMTYKANSKNDLYLKPIENAYANLGATLANETVPDFEYLNPEGKTISLKSLRGKYVYIDVWATWCAPCIAEIPSLKKLEDKYGKKNIAFVSISVDVATEKNTWLKFVQENDLHGIQVMADQDFKSAFIQKFAINNIPRFLLIGPDGKIIDNNAKRPSDPKLLEQFESLKL